MKGGVKGIHSTLLLPKKFCPYLERCPLVRVSFKRKTAVLFVDIKFLLVSRHPHHRKQLVDKLYSTIALWVPIYYFSPQTCCRLFITKINATALGIHKRMTTSHYSFFPVFTTCYSFTNFFSTTCFFSTCVGVFSYACLDVCIVLETINLYPQDTLPRL